MVRLIEHNAAFEENQYVRGLRGVFQYKKPTFSNWNLHW